MGLAFFNTHFSLEFAKSFLGPFAALASVGSILGGVFTSVVTSTIGVFGLMVSGAVICLLPCLFFAMLTDKRDHLTNKKEYLRQRPLEAVRGIWSYVVMVAAIVMLTQLLINIINFKFNIMIEREYESIELKTILFGYVHAVTSGVAFKVQLLLTPLALRLFSLKTNHLIVVGCYLLFIPLLIIFQSTSTSLIATAFVLSKGIDYSFSV